MLKRDKDRILRMLRPHLESPDFHKPLTKTEKKKLDDGVRRYAPLHELLAAARILLEAPEGSDALQYARQITDEYWAPLRKGFPTMMELMAYSLEARNSQVLAADAILRLCSLQDKVTNEDDFSTALEKVINQVASAALDIIAAEREKRDTRASARAKRKADKAHEEHRSNRKKGKEIWSSKKWGRQADAEREIAKLCHVEKDVAGRWIREFKAEGRTDRAQQSQHSAQQRP